MGKKFARNRSVCYHFEDIFNVYFLLKIQDSSQKWLKLNFFPFCIVYSCSTLQVKNSLKIALSVTVFRDIKTFSFSAKIKVAITQLAMDLQVSKFAITEYIKKKVNNIFDKNPLNSTVLL